MDITNRADLELREGLRSLPLLHLPEGLEEARGLPPFAVARSGNVKISERFIAGGAGQQLRVKLYEPSEGTASLLPALLWIHGGGYVLGTPDGEDMICEMFVEGTGCIVISPDYRLAPEHPYPAALEDCYQALQWLASESANLNMDPNRIAIGGASAGGGLTAALALLARDRGGPKLVFQMPLYPMIDDRNNTPSSHEITDARVWNGANNRAAWAMYLGGGKSGEHLDSEETSYYAAASRAKDLTGLPPAYTCVGQLDPFRDETLQYVARLAQAGVDVEFHLYPGGYHAYEHVAPDAGISRRTKEEYVAALKRGLMRSSQS